MTICKGTNQDGSPCKKAVHKGNGEYCWLHVEQAINKSDGPKEIRRVYKMPVDIKIDKITEELESLQFDVNYLEARMSKDLPVEDMGEFMIKRGRIAELQKNKKELEQYKIDNFKEEKQFRVPVIESSSSNVYAVKAISKGADVAKTTTFQRAIGFQVRQLKAKERKLAKEKDLRKKKSGNVEQGTFVDE